MRERRAPAAGPGEAGPSPGCGGLGARGRAAGEGHVRALSAPGGAPGTGSVPREPGPGLSEPGPGCTSPGGPVLPGAPRRRAGCPARGPAVREERGGAPNRAGPGPAGWERARGGGNSAVGPGPGNREPRPGAAAGPGAARARPRIPGLA